MDLSLSIDPQDVRSFLGRLPSLRFAAAGALLCLGVAVFTGEPRRKGRWGYLGWTLFSASGLLALGGLFRDLDPATGFPWMTLLLASFPLAGAALYQALSETLRTGKTLPGFSRLAWVLAFFFSAVVMARGRIDQVSAARPWSGEAGTSPPMSFRLPAFMQPGAAIPMRFWLDLAPLLFFLGCVAMAFMKTWGECSGEEPNSRRKKWISPLRAVPFLAAFAALDALAVLGFRVPPQGASALLAAALLYALVLGHYRLVEVDSNTFARKILGAAGDAVLVVDLDGILRIVNPSAQSMVGMAEDELVGQPYKVVGKGLFAPSAMATLGEDSAMSEYNTEYMNTNGHRLPLFVRLLPLVDAQDRPVALACVVRDLTEQKLAERMIRKYAADAEQLYNRAVCGFHSLDRYGTIVRMNDVELSWLGMERESVVGSKKMVDLLAASSLGDYERAMEQLRNHAVLSDQEFEMQRKDGKTFSVMARAETELDGQGLVQAVHFSVLNISARRHAEERASQLAAVIQSSDDAIFGVTLEGRIGSWNLGAQRIYGYTAAEVQGKSISFLASPDRPDDLLTSLEKIARGGTLERFHTTHLQKGAAPTQVSLTVSPVRDGKGHVVGASIVARDISESKRLEKVALMDELTGLRNRRALDLLCQNPEVLGPAYGVAVGDLAGFKKMNDTLGHAVGDKALRQVAQAMLRTVRVEDGLWVFRYGGDEFVLVIPGPRGLAERIVGTVTNAVAGIQIPEYPNLKMAMDLGLVHVPEEAQTFREAIALADANMYKAKHGRAVLA